jgi:glycogen debranching enzyme
MDAAPNGRNPVTPRNGKAVEIQALTYNALSIAVELNKLFGDKNLAVDFDNIRTRMKESINSRYFDSTRDYPYDVLDGDMHKDAVRPNAVFLVSLSKVGDLLPRNVQERIVSVVEDELLTPFGLRTLSPKDRKYIGNYDTYAPTEVKDLAYHQGTVWPWLMGPYILAKVRVMGKKSFETVVTEVKIKIANLIHFVQQHGSIQEVHSGDAPYLPGGTVSQAWSVAAGLEMLDIINRQIKTTEPVDEMKQVINVKEIKKLLGAG